MIIANIHLISAFLLIANVSSFSSIPKLPSSSVTTLSRSMAEQPPTSEIATKGVTFPVPTADLSLELVRQAIGESCTLTNERCEDGYHLLRYGSKDDMPALVSLLNSDDNIQDPDSLARDFDLFHSVVVEMNGKVVGFAMTYLAYSTWEGRYLYANKIVAPNDAVETSLVHTLAYIAVRLGGQRLVWQHYQDKAPFYNKDLGAETLDGWLTLRMNPKGMDSLLASSNTDSLLPSPSEEKTTSMAKVNEAISEALTISNGNSGKVKLHLATEDDLHHIERLVDGLAVFDKEEGVIHVDGDHYRVDGFQGDSPMFKCVLIENKEDNEICGMAFFYFGYDVEKGRFLYLEDLFIDEAYRGRGYGSLFMTTLAGVAKNVGCTGFVWQALDWSTAALNFYDKIGGKVLDGRLTTRFNGNALRNFVDTRPSNV